MTMETTDGTSDIKPTPRANGMTDEQMEKLLAAAGRRKNDPEYIKRWEEAAKEGRRILEEEYRRNQEQEQNK